MADFRINQSTPTLPIAQPQPNMIDSLTQGLGTGMNLGFQARQQQQLKEEMELKKKEADDRAFDSFTTSILALNKIPSKLRPDYFKAVVVPKAQQVGYDFDPNSYDKSDDDFVEQAVQLIESFQKSPELVSRDDVRGGLHILTLKASQSGDDEQSNRLMELSKQYEPPKKSSFMRPVSSRVTEDGKPIFWDSGVGSYMTTNDAGEPEPYTGRQLPASQNPTGGAETQLRDVLQQRGLVDGAMKKLTDDKVGLIDKKWKTIGSYVDESTDPDAIYFRSLIELANTVVRHQFYGATLTNNEQAAFKEIAANRDLSPKAFKAQISAMKFAFDKMEDSIYSASEAANRPFNKPKKGGANDDPMGILK